MSDEILTNENGGVGHSGKIAVIGDLDSVLGFMAVGFTVRDVKTDEEAAEALKRLAPECAVIFICEEYAMRLGEQILRYRSSPTPAIIVIPSKNGSSGYGMAQIKSSVERAVGADIL